jgi:cytosine/adenosine deaminase-related metal-dependent hydrolase
MTPAPIDILISGGWVLTLDSDRRVFRNGAVAISGSVILDVGRADELETKYAPARRIDGTRMITTPGLINGHRHLLATAKGAQPDGNVTLVNLRDFVYPFFAALTPEDMYAYTILTTAEMIRFGTTTFEEPGCVHLDAVLEALDRVGIRCRIGPWTWDQGGPAGRNCPDWLRMDADMATQRLQKGLDVVRQFGHPLIRDAVTIEGVGTCSDKLMVEAARLALDADSLCVLHKATSVQEVAMELEAFGHRPVQHMYELGAMNDHVLMAHVTCLDESEVSLFAETGSRISQNPSSALKLSKGTTQTGKWPELLSAGVSIALGTDAENASNHSDICRAMYLAALLPRDARRDPSAVTAEQAIEMATILGAHALRLEEHIGSLEIGKQADITLFDTDDFDLRPLHNPISNLVYSATGHAVDTVLVAGRVLLDGKQHTTIEVEEARQRVEEIDRRILGELTIEPRLQWPVL